MIRDDDTRFAKVVETSRGDAIRIGSCIIEVSGPAGDDWATIIVSAMRRRAHKAETDEDRPEN